MRGTTAQLLMELTSREEAPNPDPSSSQVCRQPETISTDRGCYPTLGESASLHVRWITIELPRARHLADLPRSKVSKDVWN